MVKIYYDKDADLKYLKNKKIAVIGYGSQGMAQSQCLKDSGLDVVVGLRKGGASWAQAKKDGLAVARSRTQRRRRTSYRCSSPTRYRGRSTGSRLSST